MIFFMFQCLFIYNFKELDGFFVKIIETYRKNYYICGLQST